MSRCNDWYSHRRYKMNEADPVKQQREFYGSRGHDHLQVREDDFYSAKLTRRLVDHMEIPPTARVLEVGAGFGRFTFHLLEHCKSVVALDLTPSALAALDETRIARGIEVDRCTTLCADLNALDVTVLDQPFDYVVGFFLLHHLPDYAHSISVLSSLLVPDGRIGFLEPNRLNPLFLAQVAACADMTWKDEKGMFALSRRGVEAAYREAGLSDVRTETAGFFPPQVLNAIPATRRIEEALERRSLIHWILPFLLMSASAAVVPGSRA